MDLDIGREWRWSAIVAKLDEYMRFYNERHPCFAIGYDTSENYRKRYYKSELPMKKSFESRVCLLNPNSFRNDTKQIDNKEDI